MNSLPRLIIGPISTGILAWRVLKMQRTFHIVVDTRACVSVCSHRYEAGEGERESETRHASRVFRWIRSWVERGPPRENKEMDDERGLLFESSHIRLLSRIVSCRCSRNVFNGFTHVRPCADQLRPPCASIVPFVPSRGRVSFRQINRENRFSYIRF